MRDENASYLFNEVPLYTKQIFSVLTEDNGFYSVNENELDRLNKYIGT